MLVNFVRWWVVKAMISSRNSIEIAKLAAKVGKITSISIKHNNNKKNVGNFSLSQHEIGWNSTLLSNEICEKNNCNNIYRGEFCKKCPFLTKIVHPVDFFLSNFFYFIDGISSSIFNLVSNIGNVKFTIQMQHNNIYWYIFLSLSFSTVLFLFFFLSLISSIYCVHICYQYWNIYTMCWIHTYILFLFTVCNYTKNRHRKSFKRKKMKERKNDNLFFLFKTISFSSILSKW